MMTQSMKQIPFPFDPPAQQHSATSKAAATSVKKDAGTLRSLVLKTLQAADPAGLTDEEIQDKLGMDGSTERPRRVELVRVGFVQDSGQTRKTKTNRQATVWCCTALGLKQ